MTNSHQQALQEKHAGLDQKIAEEVRRPAPNTALLAELKKRKLRLKEQLSAG